MFRVSLIIIGLVVIKIKIILIP